MRTYDDFLRQAALSDPRFAGALDFQQMIRAAHDYATEIWRTPMHLDFVDHGIEHSFQVLRKARLILERVLRPQGEPDRLSDLERAVLTVASLIHDTGMQWDKYISPPDRIGSERSRKEHVDRGWDMLESSMGGTNTALPSLAGFTGYHSFLGSAGRIAFAHSGLGTWNRVVDQPEDDWGVDGQFLRFKLLAAALRLADEIDNGSSRIQEFGRLSGAALDDEALAHWSACYYIDDVKVADPATGLLIEVYPRIPLSSNPEIEAEILFLLDEYRLRRMREECQRVTPYLRTANTTPPLAEPRRESIRRQMLQPPPERLRALIQSKRAEREREQTARAATANHRAIVITDRDSHLQSACHEMQAAEAAGTLYRAQHVALRSGWHCSRYYQFSRLLGEGPFLDLVTKGIATVYGTENFSYVVGIGTAGAQLASRFALALTARFAYTFASAAGAAEPGLRSGHTLYEMAVELEPNARILIVDDIVGKGSSLAETVARLRAAENAPAYIRAFCLVSTGDAAELAHLDVEVPVDALALVNGVDYWFEDTDGYCAMCKMQHEIVSRER